MEKDVSLESIFFNYAKFIEKEKNVERWGKGIGKMEGREAGVMFPTGVLDETILHVPSPPTHRQSWASTGHNGSV